MSFAYSQHFTQLLGLSISKWKELLPFLWLLLLLLLLFFFFPPTFRFQMPEKVYDISLWNFIYDIGLPKSVRYEPCLSEPFSLTELSPRELKILWPLLLRNRKRYRNKVGTKLFVGPLRNFVTFRSKGSDDYL